MCNPCAISCCLRKSRLYTAGLGTYFSLGRGEGDKKNPSFGIINQFEGRDLLVEQVRTRTDKSTPNPTQFHPNSTPIPPQFHPKSTQFHPNSTHFHPNPPKPNPKPRCHPDNTTQSSSRRTGRCSPSETTSWANWALGRGGTGRWFPRGFGLRVTLPRWCRSMPGVRR